MGEDMRIALAVIGLLSLLLGLHWVSEGTGFLAYPHSPMMYLKPSWTYAGIAASLLGICLIWSARRIGNKKRAA
jgi:hypothetical protein